ncbi:MAG: polyphenol oxidase family protein, partial [Acidimicrobiales bacterium]
AAAGPSDGQASPWTSERDDGLPVGDALVGTGTKTCLAVLTAVCAPVALASPEGVHGAVHVGWRGLAAGVLQRAVGIMATLGATDVVAGLGPCVHACCYEFSPVDLDTVAARYGDAVRGATTGGLPALDLPSGVRVALAEVEVRVELDLPSCTSCGPDAFSHRRSGDEARQALLVWRDSGQG